ncbi:hypothetical protein [Streptomyces sp. NBC_01264]|uniref:hypothetical protein n=1 Tax=Streptomyces sp. NBC_01264 TaxID=2903804 RepID=UPI00224E06E9|nr:hypothetical protein [Streptomyces sp. NBC_01264]MCX4775819.1 hypothetical protein [Streptomyces sp. NBC_01264]
MVRGTSRRHLCVEKARARVKGGAAAAVAVGVAVVLLTGCGKGPAESAVADPGGPAPVAAPSRADRSCPVEDPTASHAPPTLIDGTPANTPEGERLSQAIGEQGEGAFADIYSTQIVDHPAGRVALCVTDLARGRLLVEAAHAADPSADPARADLYLSTYTERTLRDAGDELIDLKGAFPIYSVAGSHGAALEVTTTAEGAASAEFKAWLEKSTGGIPVVVTKGEQPTLLEGPMTAAP